MDKAIFLPVAALVALTFGVALLLLRARFRAAYRRQVTPGDFRYVACVSLYAMGAVDKALALAWAYVASRGVHSLIHLTYNNVFHRLAAFAAGCGVLLVIWIRLVLAVMR